MNIFHSVIPARSSSLAVILLYASMAIFSVGETRPKQAADSDCGPPNYCARTDRRFEPYPKTPAPVGEAGSIITDPNFGSRIIRVTDAKTDSHRVGESFHTPSSSQQNSWNSTTTKFYVVETGGRFLLYDFDPDKMSARLTADPNLKWRAEPQFSYAQTNLLYGMSEGSPVFQQYDLFEHKTTTVHNPADCVKLDRTDHGSAISVSADDNRFMTAIGPQQDKNYLVYIYDREKGCRWLNTQTGEVGGQWGPKGTVSTLSGFGIHDARISKSGEFAAITSGKEEGTALWEINTLNVTRCLQRAPFTCGGHHALGYSHMVNPSGRSHPMQLLVRPLKTVSSSSSVIQQLPAREGWYDKHLSWNNVDPEDKNPICLSTYSPTNPDTPGAPLEVRGPWENEIDCVEMDGKGFKVWRFAHTYSTAKNGFWSTPRGNVSQDGRFFMFTSDWQDQLGQAPNGKQYRTDVFIVELR